MQLRFLLNLAVVNVLTKKLRAILTVGGVGISVAVMVILIGLGGGLQSLVTEQISKTESQNVVTVSSKRAKQLKLDQETISKISSISGVTSVEQTVGLSGKLVYHGITLNMPVYGATGDYFGVTPHEMAAGRAIDKKSQDENFIMLSRAVLKAYGIENPDEVLDKPVKLELTINKDQDLNQEEDSRQLEADTFSVIGVVDKTSSPVSYIPAEYLFKKGVDVASQLKVSIAFPDKMQEIRESIEQMGFQTASIKDTLDQVNRIFKVIKSIIAIFAIITVMVAVFGTLNTITIELVEQTQQIGFLRIMGIKKEDVGLLFVIQSVLLSFSGALLGVSAGSLFGISANGFISAVASNVANGDQLYVYKLPSIAIIMILVLSVVLGWAIGQIPARRAIKINPLEALRE